MKEDLGAMEEGIQAKDWEKFEAAYNQGIRNANDYHKAYEKEFIVWKLPDYPPPDLDLTPLE